jgi:hypothetical protein
MNDYKGPGCLAVVWLGSSPTPFPPSTDSIFSLFLSLSVCLRSSLLTEEGRGGRWGTKSFRTRESLTLYKSFNTLWYIDQKLFTFMRTIAKRKNFIYIARLFFYFLVVFYFKSFLLRESSNLPLYLYLPFWIVCSNYLTILLCAMFCIIQYNIIYFSVCSHQPHLTCLNPFKTETSRMSIIYGS